MRKLIAASVVVALAGGFALGYGWHARRGQAVSTGASPPAREVLYYRHPMDPSITSPTLAKDSMGMDYQPVYADGGGEATPGVAVSAAVRQSLGVRTARVQPVPFARGMRATGVVAWDESRIVHLHTRVAGWVRHLHVHAVGDPVRAGQVLATLDSNELDAAQREHLVARAGSDPQLVVASRARLAALGMTPAQVDALERTRTSSRAIPVHAPMDGVITALGVRHGMYVTAQTELYALAALDPVWVEAEVLEREAGLVRVGARARIELAQQPDTARTAQVAYVYPQLDPATRAQRLRLVVPNADHSLHAGMWVSVLLDADAVEPVLAVPSDAVIHTGAGARVVLALPDGRFAVRSVRTGRTADGNTEVLDGLAEGEEVVASGQFLLDADASAQPALAALDGATAETAASPGAVTTPATVRALDVAAATITLEHPAIEALGMPAMTMPFALAPGVDVSDLEPGQAVRARIAPSPRGYVVTALSPADAP